MQEFDIKKLKKSKKIFDEENDDDEEEDDGDEEEQEHDNTIENDPMIKLTKTPTKKIPAKKFRIKQTHFLIFTFLYHDEII
ncbi:unnamed protein product [Rotaria sordida]|uniref:Uncharacterized protein n=1 Tax=Rotaria sordida TaxID=392033 RepID=A0A814AKJ1_9BILA|nr:unnamed protein product [Rotaria sordida]